MILITKMWLSLTTLFTDNKIIFFLLLPTHLKERVDRGEIVNGKLQRPLAGCVGQRVTAEKEGSKEKAAWGRR